MRMPVLLLALAFVRMLSRFCALPSISLCVSSGSCMLLSILLCAPWILYPTLYMLLHSVVSCNLPSIFSSTFNLLLRSQWFALPTLCLPSPSCAASKRQGKELRQSLVSIEIPQDLQDGPIKKKRGASLPAGGPHAKRYVP